MGGHVLAKIEDFDYSQNIRLKPFHRTPVRHRWAWFESGDASDLG